MLHWLDWLLIIGYVIFAMTIGVVFARRAGKSVDEYFLTGRTLPWWIAGTSIVATTFAADTPLVVSGWVRDYGIWKNWAWWCFALNGMLAVFLFARWWRRGGVMTKAELAELRYGGDGAKFLRGFIGVIHAFFTNTLIMCWVVLAASKIMEGLFGIDKVLAVTVACAIAMSYSLMAGLWGVVLTDIVQFLMSMAGAIILAVLGWRAVGGTSQLLESAAESESFTANTLNFLPAAGSGGVFDATFWTVPFAAFVVYLGVSWWASEGVDGDIISVQRISATRDERQGMLAVLWYNIAHYALRPWPWILVGLASLVILPHVEMHAPQAGTVTAITDTGINVGEIHVPFRQEGVTDHDWMPEARVAVGDHVEEGQLIGRTDSERAYVTMAARYLPVGLLGLVAASLLAAFMSTIDTHVNLASSFFVNDIYRRFLKRNASPRHYVFVARLASVGVLVVAGAFAVGQNSIGHLYFFFLSFLGGVGPVYVMRWLWWRVRPSTEIAALATSGVLTTLLTIYGDGWALGPLSPDGVLAHEGRIIMVVGGSLIAALASMALTRRPEPASLVDFYRKVRPAGWWGPVRALVPEYVAPNSTLPIVVGILGGGCAIYGTLFAIGGYVLERSETAMISSACSLVGIVCVAWSLRRLPS